MARNYLWSTVLMGLFIVAVVAYLRAEDWRGYSPRGEGPGLAGLAEDVAGSPVVWILTFLGLLAVFGGGALAFVGGLPVGDPAVWGTVLIGFAALTVGGFAFVGSYWSARSRGKPSSFAVGEGVALLGLLAIVTVAAKLFFA